MLSLLPSVVHEVVLSYRNMLQANVEDVYVTVVIMYMTTSKRYVEIVCCMLIGICSTGDCRNGNFNNFNNVSNGIVNVIMSGSTLN